MTRHSRSFGTTRRNTSLNRGSLTNGSKAKCNCGAPATRLVYGSHATRTWGDIARRFLAGAPLPVSVVACEEHYDERVVGHGTVVVLDFSEPGLITKTVTFIGDDDAALGEIRDAHEKQTSIFGPDSLWWRRTLLAFSQQDVHKIDLGVAAEDLADAASASLEAAHDYLSGRIGDQLDQPVANEILWTFKWARTALLEKSRTTRKAASKYQEGAYAKAKRFELEIERAPLAVCVRCRKVFPDRLKPSGGNKPWLLYCPSCPKNKVTPARRARLLG